VAGSCTWLPIVEGNRPLTRIAMWIIKSHNYRWTN
jgi:hypothetical protein